MLLGCQVTQLCTTAARFVSVSVRGCAGPTRRVYYVGCCCSIRAVIGRTGSRAREADGLWHDIGQRGLISRAGESFGPAAEILRTVPACDDGRKTQPDLAVPPRRATKKHPGRSWTRSGVWKNRIDEHGSDDWWHGWGRAVADGHWVWRRAVGARVRIPRRRDSAGSHASGWPGAKG